MTFLPPLILLFNYTASVFVEIVNNFVHTLVKLVSNFRVNRCAVVVLCIIISKNVKPVLSVLIEEGRVIILNIFEILECHEPACSLEKWRLSNQNFKESCNES